MENFVVKCENESGIKRLLQEMAFAAGYRWIGCASIIYRDFTALFFEGVSLTYGEASDLDASTLLNSPKLDAATQLEEIISKLDAARIERNLPPSRLITPMPNHLLIDTNSCRLDSAVNSISGLGDSKNHTLDPKVAVALKHTEGVTPKLLGRPCRSGPSVMTGI